AKNGAKFVALWNGNTGDYGSQSEADIALCSHLSFWTGKNPERMDALFRQSGLFRDKWDRTDYRLRTIAAAIKRTHDTYAPAGSPLLSAVPAGQRNSNGNGSRPRASEDKAEGEATQEEEEYIEFAPAFLAGEDPPTPYLIEDLLPEGVIAL